MQKPKTNLKNLIKKPKKQFKKIVARCNVAPCAARERVTYFLCSPPPLCALPPPLATLVQWSAPMPGLALVEFFFVPTRWRLPCHTCLMPHATPLATCVHCLRCEHFYDDDDDDDATRRVAAAATRATSRFDFFEILSHFFFFFANLKVN